MYLLFTAPKKKPPRNRVVFFVDLLLRTLYAYTMTAHIILGIDPGLNKTGWGVITSAGSRISCLGSGTIKTKPKTPDAERLNHIHTELLKVITQFQPTQVAVEEVFVNTNARSSLKLGQARGIALLVGAEKTLPVAEYTALQVKKSVVGYGRAEKEQIGHMIKLLLPTAKPDSEDAADALAVAITHAHNVSSPVSTA